MVDSDEVLENLLDLLMDESKMMSPHGVRSLSARDQFYMIEPNMYRGNIFVHLHYLLLRGLKTYYMDDQNSLAHSDKASKAYNLIKERIT